MVLATVTVGGVFTLIGLIVLFLIVLVAFLHWAGGGYGILGFFVARDLFDLLGTILAAIIQCVAELLSSSK